MMNRPPNTPPLPPGQLVTVTATARFLGVSVDTVRRWIDAGDVFPPDAVVHPSGARRRLRRSAVLALVGETEEGGEQ